MTDKARQFRIEYFDREKAEFTHKTNFKAETLIDAMNYANAMYPHFQEQGIDWMVNGVLGLLMKSPQYILYLSDIKAEEYDLDNYLDD